MKDECLNGHLFANLRHTRASIGIWCDDYDPHLPPHV
ncbi:hypothetical protein [uncultured Shimia sp.]